MVSNLFCYGDFPLGGKELEEVKSLRILGVIFDSKLMLGTHLPEVVSKAARPLDVVRRAGKLFDCPQVLKSCFNAYVLLNLEYRAPVWKPSAESHLSLLDSVVRSAEGLGEGELCCLRQRGRSVLSVCSMRFITEWTTLCMSI